MPNALSETSDPIVLAHPPDGPRGQRVRPWHGWLKWIALAAACLWLVDVGISLLIGHTALKRRLTARLEAAFGRPVEVGSYGFSLWTGPQLEARSIRVAEDPRFGEEYFLRAESLSVRLRWLSLLSGHIELGTVSLSHPSLNLVRAANGDWNLSEWLPRPVNSVPPVENSPARFRSSPAPRFRKIQVNAGRINFKRGNEKLPFAFVDVDGTLETESPGLWRLNLVAVPERAAAIVQDPGALHFVGHFGGTSSRLRPAVLEVDWTGASIPDVLRLATDRDYGLRGGLGISVTAHTQGVSWVLKGNAFLSQLHRWDLPLRSDNPSLSIRAGGRLDASGSRIELTSAEIDAPHSSASVRGALDWTNPGPPFAKRFPPPLGLNGSRRRFHSQVISGTSGTQLHVVSKAVSLDDLLEWARAFHPGIADTVSAAGLASFGADLAGWPPRFEQATLDLPRGVLGSRGVLAPVRIVSVAVGYDPRHGISFSPATVSIGAVANSFRVEGSANATTGDFSVSMRGGTSNVRDIVTAARQFGWNLARGWTVSGPARCDLHWQGTAEPWHSTLAGAVEWGTPADGVSLAAPFLNQPVEQIRARAELKPGVTRLTLSSARAFGAHWTGTLDHELADGWKFSIAGDSLSAADLDRWLDPRWRESFLDRMLPFLNPDSRAPTSLETLHASGRVALGDFSLGPVNVHRVQGDLNINARNVEFTNISGEFYGGKLAGSLRAALDSTPRYEASIEFSGVDLPALSADFSSLAGQFAGSASAKVRFGMRGSSRSDLLNSLECLGTASATNFSIETINFGDSAADSNPSESVPAGPGLFSAASAAFSCASGKIKFQNLLLSGASGRWDGSGAVDFGRNLDLLLRPAPAGSLQPLPTSIAEPSLERDRTEAPGYSITGTLESPRISHTSNPPRATQGSR